MADFPLLHSPPPQSAISQHHILEQQERTSPEQTLDHSNTNCSSLIEDNDGDDDDDLVNVDDEDIPCTFIIDPFSPLDSSFFAPPSSSSSQHHKIRQVNSDSPSRCSSEPESESDCAGLTAYPDCLHGRDDEYDETDFITDLFDSRRETQRRLSSTDVGIHVSERNTVDNFVSSNIEELGLGLGLGLRAARIESESDTEDLGADRADRNDDRIENTDFDAARVDDRERLSSVIDLIEEVSVSSDEHAAGGVSEWEILLAVNNLERDLEHRDLEHTPDRGEGFVYTPEFDTLIGQFVESVRGLSGTPPAAKSFIDNLPSVAMNVGDVEGDENAICAVCKDEVLVDERVTELPCKHRYHGDCIVPWLSVRNTCPVCRFELPTDDADYERSKNRGNDDELRVGYGF